MDGADGTQHYEDERTLQEQSPSLLTVILDTNPAAWALLRPTLSLSSALADILVLLNAHLACNFTNQVAVIASHCDKAQWLYPTAHTQQPPSSAHSRSKAQAIDDGSDEDQAPTNRNKRIRLNGSARQTHQVQSSFAETESNKYRPFRLIEEELSRNLRHLVASTPPEVVQEKTSTMIAGALTLALSYINRRSQEYQESLTGVSSNLADQSAAIAADPTSTSTNALESRILIITLSPSTDLAHQYIPIMNSIFACQRLNIPIDVMQLALPSDSNQQSRISSDGTKSSQSSTVFLQQASDATHGVFIAAKLTPDADKATTQILGPDTITSIAQHSMLTYLLSAFLPSPASRQHLITPTRVDVDFRAACFCHRNVISTGFVCSICLSIFCDESLEILAAEGCITCGTRLSVRGEGIGGWSGGKRPVVVAPKKKRKKRRIDGIMSGSVTPRPA